MLFYRVPSADEAMLLRGWRVEGDPFRIVEGGAFVVPFLRRATFLPLSPQDVDVEQTCYEQQGIELVVSATVSFRVEDVKRAGERYATNPDRMRDRVRQLFGDRLARVAGTMGIEEIAVSARADFIERTVTAAEKEMTRIGLACDGLAITNLSDRGEGYLYKLGSVKRAAMDWAQLTARKRTDDEALAVLMEGRDAPLPDGRLLGEAAKEQVDRYAETWTREPR